MVGRVHGLIVEEVKPATEPEGVLFGLVHSVALRLGPQLFGVLWHCWSW